MAASEYEMRKRDLMKQVSVAYLRVVYLQHKYRLFHFLDSLNRIMLAATEKNYELGGNNYLDKLNAVSQQEKMRTGMKQLQEEIAVAYKALKGIIGVDTLIVVPQDSLEKLTYSGDTLQHPGLQYYDYARQATEARNRLEKNKLLPDLQVEYFQGTNSYAGAKTYPGFTVGLAVPLWFGAQRSRIRSTQIEKDMVDNRAAYYKEQLESRRKQLTGELKKYQEALNYYEQHGRLLASQLIRSAQVSYENGEIDLFRYIMTVQNATEIELTHLDNLFEYDRTVLELEYFNL
jgi:cobalt-zinc-cadmium resistance protein CzcA